MEIDLSLNVFELFDKKKGLITAGSIDNHNTMTIGWGNLGVLWGKPCATVYVRPSRHTYKFTENNDYFTVSFLHEEYKKAIGVMGKLSGRDCNKDVVANLSPIKYENGDIKAVYYKEAELSFICKKVYFDDIVPNLIPESAKKVFYPTGDFHRVYIGEIVDIIKG